jgi:Periplasmic copper-binding protein (NosD)
MGFRMNWTPKGENNMKGLRTLGVVALLIVGLTAVSLARVAPSPQSPPEETISGTISATRTITQNARLTGDVTCTVQAAPCIQLGAPGITLNLSGFTITGLGDPSGGCQGTNTANENGILTNNQTDVTIQGPGLVQRFRASGILLTNSSSRIRVVNVTVSTNCQSGLLVSNLSDSHIESNVFVRNGNVALPCGGL